MPDTSVKIFNSSMAGAPTLGGSVGSLIAVLDACLKDGFGLKTVDSLVVAGGVATANISTGHSAIKDAVVLIAGATPAGLNGEKKVISITGTAVTFDATGISDQTATGTITLKLAPAGWSKTFSGTNLAAYKANNVAATGCLLRVDDTATLSARVVGYEAMTDVNTGSGPFPTAAQQSGGLYWPKANTTSGTRAWWIAANDRFFYVGIARHSSFTGDYVNYAFGDIASNKSPDAYKCFISGSTTDVSAAAPASSQSDHPHLNKNSGASAFCSMPRAYTQLGGAIIVNPTWNGFSTGVSGQVGTPYQYPNGPDNGLLLDNVSLYENSSTCLRGKLPGMLACMQQIGTNLTHDSYVTSIPGFSGRSFLWKIAGHQTSTSRGGFALDITGPWAA